MLIIILLILCLISFSPVFIFKKIYSPLLCLKDILYDYLHILDTTKASSLRESIIELKIKGRIHGQKNLPEYKFYTKLIKTVIEKFKVFGGDFSSMLSLIQKFISLDQRKELKLKHLFLGYLYQNIFTIILSSLFFIGIFWSLERECNYLILTTILAFQMAIALVSVELLKQKRKSDLSNLEFAIKKLTFLNLLIGSGISISMAMKEVKMEKFYSLQDFKLRPIQEGLIHALETIHKFGSIDSKIFEDLLSDLYFIYGNSISRLEKYVFLLKVTVIPINYFLGQVLIFFTLGDIFAI